MLARGAFAFGALALFCSLVFHLSDGRPGGVFEGAYGGMSRVAGAIGVAAWAIALTAYVWGKGRP